MKSKRKHLFMYIATGVTIVVLSMILINPSVILASYNYSYIEVEGGISITAAPEMVGDTLEVPSEIDDKTVVQIATGALKNASHVTELIIPQTVKEIECGAFSGMKYLETITLPFIGATSDATGAEKTLGYMFGSITGTGVYTRQVYSETGSEGYYLPHNLKTITVLGGSLGYGSFSNCKSLETVVISSDDVTEVPAYTFKSTSALQKVVLPEGVTTIGNKAFYRSGVQSVNLSNVTYIGNEAFVDANIKMLDISSVNTIGNKAFYGLTQLKDITFGENLQSIGEYAFAHCSLLAEVDLPASVSVIGKGVFYQDTRLTTINCDSTYFTVEDNVLYRKDKEELLVYPAGKTDVAFSVPDSVYMIEEQAFNGNKYLQTITVSANTSQIGYAAFSACPSLKSLNVYFVGARADAEGQDAVQGYVFGKIPFENCVTQADYYCFPKNVTVTILGQ